MPVKIRKILILFANPRGTPKLRTGREEKIIRKALGRRKKLKLTFIRATGVADLRRRLLDERFDIVQISGHGTPDGLILERGDGEAQPVEPAAFADFISKHDSVKCLILNTCSSLAQGLRTAASVPLTVAMVGKVSDRAAIEFSRGFYEAVGAGKSLEFAYREGVDNVRMLFPQDDFRAELIRRDECVRETQLIRPENPPHGFADVLYSAEPPAASGFIPAAGTLLVHDAHLEFNAPDFVRIIGGIVGIGPLPADADWFEVVYTERGLRKSAWLAESAVHFGSWPTATEPPLAHFLRARFGSAVFPVHPQPVERPVGPAVRVEGRGNVVSGRNTVGNYFVSGNFVVIDREK